MRRRHTKDRKELLRLAREKLRARGDSVSEVLKTGRRVPTHLRKELRVLAEAEALAQHPKLARLIDERAQSRATRSATHRIRAIDRGAERRRLAFGILASAGFGVLTALVLFLAVLRLRGFI